MLRWQRSGWLTWQLLWGYMVSVDAAGAAGLGCGILDQATVATVASAATARRRQWGRREQVRRLRRVRCDVGSDGGLGGFFGGGECANVNADERGLSQRRCCSALLRLGPSVPSFASSRFPPAACFVSPGGDARCGVAGPSFSRASSSAFRASSLPPPHTGSPKKDPQAIMPRRG